MKISNKLLLSVGIILILGPLYAYAQCNAGCEICFEDDLKCFQCTDTTKTPESECACKSGTYLDGTCKTCMDNCETCDNGTSCTSCTQQDGLGLFPDGTCDCVKGFKKNEKSGGNYCIQLYLYGDQYVDKCPSGTNQDNDVHICEVPKEEDVLPGDRVALLICALIIIIVLIILSLMLYLYLVKKMIQQFQNKRNGIKTHSEDEMSYLINNQERERNRLALEQQGNNQKMEEEMNRLKKKLQEEADARRQQMEQDLEDRKREMERQRMLQHQAQMEDDKKRADKMTELELQHDIERSAIVAKDKKLRDWEGRAGNGPITEEFGRFDNFMEDMNKEKKIEEMKLRKWEAKNDTIIKEPYGQLEEFMKDMAKEQTDKDNKFLKKWETKNGKLNEDDPIQWEKYQQDHEEARKVDDEKLLAEWDANSKGEQDDNDKLKKYDEDMEKARSMLCKKKIQRWEQENGRLADRFDRHAKIADQKLRKWEEKHGSILDGKYGQLKFFLKDLENEQEIADQAFKDEWERKNGKINGNPQKAAKFQDDLALKRIADDDAIVAEWDSKSESMSGDERRIIKYEDDMEKARRMMGDSEIKIADQRLRQWEQTNGPVVKPPQGQLKKFMEDDQNARMAEEAQFRKDWESKNGQIQMNAQNKRKFFEDSMNAKKADEEILLQQWEAKSRNQQDDVQRVRKYQEDMIKARSMGGDRDNKIADMRLRAWEAANGPILRGQNGQLRRYLRDEKKRKELEEIEFKSKYEQKNGRIMGEDANQAYQQAYKKFLEEQEDALVNKWDSECTDEDEAKGKLQKYGEDWAEAIRLSKLKFEDDMLGGLAGKTFQDAEMRKRQFREEMEGFRESLEKSFYIHEKPKRRYAQDETKRVRKYEEDMIRGRSLEDDLVEKARLAEEAARLKREQEERDRLAAEAAERKRLADLRRQERQLTRMQTQSANDDKLRKMREERDRIMKEKAAIEKDKSGLLQNAEGLGNEHADLLNQNAEVDKRRKECIAIREGIIKKQQDIANKRKELETQMDGLDYEGTRDKVKNMNQEDLIFVQNLRNPPSRVVLCLEAVTCVLYNNIKKMVWKDIKQVIGNMNFRKDIVSFDTDHLTDKVGKHVQKSYINDPEWNVAKMYKAAKACGILSEWIDALMKFKKMLSENKDLFAAVKEMRSVENSMDADMERLEELEKQEKEMAQVINVNSTKINSAIEKQKTLMKSVTIREGDISNKNKELEALRTDNLELAKLSELSEGDEEDDSEDERNAAILNDL